MKVRRSPMCDGGAFVAVSRACGSAVGASRARVEYRQVVRNEPRTGSGKGPTPREDGGRSVDENTAAGVDIGSPVAAVDPESDPLTYSSAGSLVSDLSYPWGIAFAPNGTMLFTERAGVLSARLADGTVTTAAGCASARRATCGSRHDGCVGRQSVRAPLASSRSALSSPGCLSRSTDRREQVPGGARGHFVRARCR